jgi:hypothetical protein
MSLLTGKPIKARAFTPLPMPEDVGIQVERIGTSKNARPCADGRPQNSLYQKWKSSSPTVRTESLQ